MMIDFKYLFNKYKIKATGILHVGASTAQEAETYEELGIPEVVWVEAISEIYEQAKENLVKYKNQYIVNACVGEEDGTDVIFNISNNEAQSSSYLELGEHKRIHPTVHYIDKFECKTVRLDTLFKHTDISALNFLNFDIQGTELLALKGMGDLLAQFDYCYLEVNKKETYIGGALIHEIDEFLMDFNRVETGQWVGECWTDALYIRRTIL